MDQEALASADPLAGDEAGQLRAIQSSARAVVDILDHGALLELRELEQAREPPALPMQALALEQQRQALLEGQFLGGRLGHLLAQRKGHARQLQAVQCIEQGLDEHGSSSPWSLGLRVERK
jgi:hypothetical protein